MPYGLDTQRRSRQYAGMAHSFLTFDFGADEEAAQQARHRIEGWKQAFRLDKKIQIKFDRKEQEETPEEVSASLPTGAKSGKKGKGKSRAEASSGAERASATDSAAAESAQIRLIVRLDFSDHEKLSHQRWIERIPTEEPFKAANPRVVRAGDGDFSTISDLFDSLD